MARSVTDLAKLLDVMVGYDVEDPMTAHGVGKTPSTYTAKLDADALRGARIGILRQPMGHASEPDSEDFAKITAVFDKAVAELADAGATVIDPIAIPNLTELLDLRAGEGSTEAFRLYMSRNANPPYRSYEEMKSSPLFASTEKPSRPSFGRPNGPDSNYHYLKARDELETIVLKVMADHQLDAIVHKTVEHQPTLIRDGLNPPYYNSRGAPHLNTFLIYAASLTVPAGFTTDELPVGITFFGRAYSEPSLLGYAYAYEQATHHRTPPPTTPPLD
jgi:Asp-tRNA(Asn)/Glu-tRNA(Gln) amidotransferase A subunit family amidase